MEQQVPQEHVLPENTHLLERTHVQTVLLESSAQVTIYQPRLAQQERLLELKIQLVSTVLLVNLAHLTLIHQKQTVQLKNTLQLVSPLVPHAPQVTSVQTKQLPQQNFATMESMSVELLVQLAQLVTIVMVRLTLLAQQL